VLETTLLKRGLKKKEWGTFLILVKGKAPTPGQEDWGRILSLKIPKKKGPRASRLLGPEMKAKKVLTPRKDAISEGKKGQREKIAKDWVGYHSASWVTLG